jgi:VanZ family protein
MRPPVLGPSSARGGQGVGTLRTINMRWFFWAYAALVFTVTHWPRLELHNPVPRTDLYIHMTCFGVWMIALMMCSFFGPRWSKQNIGMCCVVSLLYAAVDEGLQFPSFLGRTVALDDFGANALGVLVASVLLLLRGKMRGWQSGY